MAPGYERAMHGLCESCHREQEKALTATERYLSRCAACHRNEFADDAEMRARPPFAIVAAGSGPGHDPTRGDAAPEGRP
jgi:hypothetical protein